MNFKDFLKFSISHHHPHQYYRCYNLKGLHICARCLGLYPIMFILIVLQFYFTFPLKYEYLIIYIAPIPAIIDWALGFIWNIKSHNIIRTLTGFFLGISWARILFLHIQDPFNKTSLRGFFMYFMVVSFVISFKFMINMLKHYDDY